MWTLFEDSKESIQIKRKMTWSNLDFKTIIWPQGKPDSKGWSYHEVREGGRQRDGDWGNGKQTKSKAIWEAELKMIGNRLHLENEAE